MICKITHLVSRKFGCVEKIYYLCAVFRNAKVQNLFLLTKLKPLKMKKKSLILVFTTCLMLFITACSSSTDELTSGATSMKEFHQTNPNGFFEMCGDKFNNIIY